MLKTILILFVLYSCDRDNSDEGGLLWRISGNGLKEPSYLFGTNHGMNGDFLDSIPRFFEILDSVRQLAVESDISKIGKLDSIKLISRCLPTDTTYIDLLDEDELATLDSVLLVCFNANSEKIRLKPNILTISIQMAEIQKESGKWAETNPFLLVVKQNVDLRVIKIAKFRCYPIIELDTKDELDRLGLWDMSILFSSTNLKEQAKEMVSFIRKSQEDRSYIDLTKKVMEAYYNQDLEQIEKWFVRYADLKDEKVKSINYAMTTERNIFWMDTILSSVHEQSTLILVGAAHLPGKDGVINLLRKEGYSVNSVK
ncbi:MAG TPA: hypothetical protein DD381_11280 [Lentisphaeria bacterium]|nr:MAG: hypothetical protein A2W89_13520 [Bacteroidetes bacterium GWE2_42_39]HBM16911.1 hypothetical protein [Lentisphaeria bacterium]